MGRDELTRHIAEIDQQAARLEEIIGLYFQDMMRLMVTTNPISQTDHYLVGAALARVLQDYLLEKVKMMEE